MEQAGKAANTEPDDAEQLAVPAGPSVGRLVGYRRLCGKAAAAGKQYVLSREIGRQMGVRASLVRKDLSQLGRLGIRGKGYEARGLAGHLSKLLGEGRNWDLVLIGVGHLGSALLNYVGFRRQRFRFVAAFDTDPTKSGVERGGVTIAHPADFRRALRGVRADIGIITVPADRAQQAADLLVCMGVRAILNMAPVKLRPIGGIAVSNLDLALELEKLALRLLADGEVRSSFARPAASAGGAAQ